MKAVRTAVFFLATLVLSLGGAGTLCAAQEDGTTPKGVAPESFFQPVEDQYFEQLPAAEGVAPAAETFWDPADQAFFESLPRAIDERGLPAEDFDEDLWREQFESAVAEAKGGEDQPWVQSKGYLEYRGTYSTNIDLSSRGSDADLRVKPNETEVNDWINGFFWGYDKEFAIVPDQMKGALRYDGGHYSFADETREDSTFHNLELASIQKLSDTLEWEMFGGILLDSRQPGAQYFREDFFQWHLGTEVRKDLGDGRQLTAGYQWRHRDYETRKGIIINTEETPFLDWHEHRAWTTYSTPITEKLFFDLSMTFSRRDYESQTLTDIGNRIPGTFRQYDSWEPLAALTVTPTEYSRMSAYYRYEDLTSTGQFYDYDQHAYGLLFEQDLCPQRCEGLKLISQFEYSDRNYDHQVALPGGGVRDDEQVTFYLALERRFRECMKAGVDFTYTNNDSNDHDSEYQEDRYGVYVRYDF